MMSTTENIPPAAPAEGAEQTAAAAGAAPAAPSPEELLRQSEAKAQEHYDAWLRAKAEADNTRKRAQADVASAHKFAIEGFATALLAVRDSLEAALAAPNATVESMRTGAELTLKQLDGAFARFSVTEINPAGEKFDPHRHQAMTAVESDAEPNTVVSVMQKGYLLNDRVIRPALVAVAKAKST